MSERYHRFHPQRSVFCSILAIALVYIATLSTLEKRGFWITDNANKFLQAQAFAKSNYTDFSIPWPGLDLDPDFVYNPLPYHFTHIESGKFYSVFSPVFASISAFFFSYLGFWGLYLLPLFSSLIMLVGIARLARLVTPKISVGHTAILLTGLCSPVFFYSLVLWEHTPAICLGIWSIRYLVQFLTDSAAINLYLGMAAAGLSVYFRDELYLLCLVLTLCTAFSVKKGRVKVLLASVLILFVALLPLWLLQWLSIGHPFGYHLSTHLSTITGLVEHLQTRPRIFYNLFVASNPIPLLSLAIALPFIATSLLRPHFSLQTFQKAIPIYSIISFLCAGLSLGGYFLHPSPIDYMLKSSNAFFTSAPFVALAFLRSDVSDARVHTRLIGLTALCFATLYVLTAPKVGSMGIHWGNRFLLILYPLFAILAANNLITWLERQKYCFSPGLFAVGSVVVLSLAAQIYGISILKEKKDFSHRLNSTISQRSEEVLITNLPWVSHALYSQFYNKAYFYVPTSSHFDQLVPRLSKRGYKSYIFVTQQPQSPLQPSVEVDDPGLNYFKLQFFAQTIPNH